MTFVFNEFYVIAVLLALLLGSLWLGRRWGLTHDQDVAHLGVIQGATIGLLGLLIGFTFSGAIDRFVIRQDIIAQEANAIGTSWLRADLLAEPSRVAVRDALRAYTQRRVALFGAHDEQTEMAIQRELAALQSRAWRAAVDGVADRPPLAAVVLPPLNDVFDLLSLRNAASRRHIPVEVMVVLIACAMLTAAIISFGRARRGLSVQLPAIGLVILIAAVISVTIDLDFPRRGFVRISDLPLKDLLESMNNAVNSQPASAEN